MSALAGCACCTRLISRAPDDGRLCAGELRGAAHTQAHVLPGANKRVGWRTARSYTLSNSRIARLTDVSALAGCPTLHTLHVSFCAGLTDTGGLRDTVRPEPQVLPKSGGRVGAGGLRDAVQARPLVQRSRGRIGARRLRVTTQAEPPKHACDRRLGAGWPVGPSSCRTPIGPGRADTISM